jgi:hypothetical protein
LIFEEDSLNATSNTTPPEPEQTVSQRQRQLLQGAISSQNYLAAPPEGYRENPSPQPVRTQQSAAMQEALAMQKNPYMQAAPVSVQPNAQGWQTAPQIQQPPPAIKVAVATEAPSTPQLYQVPVQTAPNAPQIYPGYVPAPMPTAAPPAFPGAQLPQTSSAIPHIGVSAAQGDGFLSHLLGLDHHGQSGHLHGHPQADRPGMHNGPSNRAIWLSALSSVKLSHAFKGINVSANMAFALMFVAFTFWLYVVYWIRHHEPMAASVLGSHAPMTHRAMVDHQLVDGMKTAIPVQTLVGGTVYVPNTTEEMEANRNAQANQAQAQQNPGFAAPSQSAHYPILSTAGAAMASSAPSSVDPRFGDPTNASYGNASFRAGSQTNNAPLYNTPRYQQNGGYQNGAAQMQQFSQQQGLPNGQIMQVPSSGPQGGQVTFGASEDGSRLKMFVNR